MGKYNFEDVLDRRGTACQKWDLAESEGYPEDILPMWVADMDFAVMPEITEALVRRIQDHPIYGYSVTVPGHDEAVCSWMKRRHGWDAKPEWIVSTPGVVCAFKTAVQCFTEPGEAVMLQKPVYYPMIKGIEDNGRKLVNNALVNINGHYEIDFEDFEKKIVENDVKLFILCSPHNPVGRVWTKEELTRMGDICLKYHVIMVVDEIHEDFVFAPNKFLPFLSLKKEYEEIAVVCTAPSKTFNVAGLKFSSIFIPNPELRNRFYRHLVCCGVNNNNMVGSIASKTAYELGDEYVDELVEAIKSNVDFFRDYLAEKLPMLKMIEPEGLYLVWVDVSAFGLEDEELKNFMIYDAKVWLDEGYIFGPEGHNFERFNLAHSKAQIKEAIDRIRAAAERRGLIEKEAAGE